MNVVPNFCIEPCSSGDAEIVASLARRIWAEAYSAIISQAQIEHMLNQRFERSVLAHELGGTRSRYWLAKCGQDAVGYASLQLERDVRGFKIQQLYVCQSVQRSGLGRALLKTMISEIVARGGRKAWLTVNRKNARAIEFYERNGFDNAGKMITDIGGGFVMDDFVMEKNLVEK